MTSSTELLKKCGLANPQRTIRLIHDTIDFLDLNLNDKIVLTEAASGMFVFTPIIAALAGAKRVIAISRTSKYAEFDEVVSLTKTLETLAGFSGFIEFQRKKERADLEQADIVTNLGFVRPIDASAIEMMKGSAVIPTMYEAWELREDDIDIQACRKRGIKVAGTNEDFPGLDVFKYSGWLAEKLLFEANIELFKSSLLIVSSDKFGRVIRDHLKSRIVSCSLVNDLKDVSGLSEKTDAVIIADFTRSDLIIGTDGDINPRRFSEVFPRATVVQFAGEIDVDQLRAENVHVYPGVNIPPRRMVRTLGYLGPRPVIELHTAGLKVGEIYTSDRDNSRFLNLVQEIV